MSPPTPPMLTSVSWPATPCPVISTPAGRMRARIAAGGPGVGGSGEDTPPARAYSGEAGMDAPA